MKKSKDIFVLLLRNRNRDIRHGNGYGVMEISVVKLVGGSTVENPEYQHAFDGLEFRAQWNTNNETEHTYGWETLYGSDRLGHIHLAAAHSMFNTLKKAEKAYLHAKIKPRSFGQYVTTVCLALGISGVMKESVHSADVLTYRDRDFNYWSIEDAAYLIDGQIQADRLPATPIAQ